MHGTLARQSFGRHPKGLGIQVPKAALRARSQKPLRDGKADATGAACDHRIFPLQVYFVH